MEFDIKDIDGIVEEVGRQPKAVIPILQAIQGRFNYLPEEALRRVCEISEITPAQIVGVASFYSQFRFKPAGKHLIKVCVGTACHVKGAGQVYDAMKRELGLAESEDTTPSGDYTIEKVNCLGCCTLAPVVQIDGVTYGHVSTSKVASVLSDFESQEAGSKKRKYKYAGGGEVKGEIRIGLGSCCVASGSDEIRDAVKDTIDRKGLNVKLKHVGCVGMCHQVPLVEIVPVNGEPTLYSKVDAADVEQIVERHFQPEGFVRRLSSRLLSAANSVRDDSRWDGVDRYSLDVREKHVSLFLDKQIPMATEFRGVINPVDVEEYKQRNGFRGLLRVLKEMSPQEVIDEIIESGIRGRGGGGFPTGKKWQLVADAENETKYIICNGDEGDPGAFMDRMLLESYPYRIIEGLIAAGYAVGAAEGILYIRAEYPLAVTRILQALEVCREAGLPGEGYFGDRL